MSFGRSLFLVNINGLNDSWNDRAKRKEDRLVQELLRDEFPDLPLVGGNVIKHFASEEPREFHSSAVKFGRMTVVGDTDGKLYDVETGKIVAEFPGQITPTPLVMEGGALFVKAANGFFKLDSNFKITKLSDLQELRRLFEERVGGWPIQTVSSPTRLKNGTIVIGSDNGQDKGRVFFFSKEGRALKLTFPTKGVIQSSPLGLENGSLVVTTHAGIVYFLTPEGKEIISHSRLELNRASPIQLGDKTVLIKGGKGFYLFSQEGKFIGEYELSGASSGEATPIQLESGDIAIVGHGFFLLSTPMKNHQKGGASFIAPRMHVTPSSENHK